MPNLTAGATDYTACPTRRNRSMCHCQPRCAICGWGKHDAIHGPKYGEPPGSEPWGHAFAPSCGPEDNPSDDEQPTKEEWEAWEREQQDQPNDTRRSCRQGC
jgi:hypothetical protein